MTFAGEATVVAHMSAGPGYAVASADVAGDLAQPAQLGVHGRAFAWRVVTLDAGHFQLAAMHVRLPRSVVRLHEIVIQTESNLLNVTETILVSNPSSYCYVGGAEGKRPVTLRLHIPPHFEKVTFHKEFYGRRFAMIDGALMTTIPWPPGERELKFTYILPIEKQHQVWERPLDLPCGAVRLSVIGSDSKGITCNLPSGQATDSSELVFEHQGTFLPAGHTIRVAFGRLPVPFSAYGRWIALGILATLIVVVAVAMLVKRPMAKREGKSTVQSDQRMPHRRGGSKRRSLPVGSE